VADQHTRYLLACHGLRSTRPWRAPGLRPAVPRVRPAGRDSHRQWGPVRDDRIHGLSQLNVCGCGSHSAPAHPTRVAAENGAHERMHKTLKAERFAHSSHARAPAARVQSLPRRVQRRSYCPPRYVREWLKNRGLLVGIWYCDLLRAPLDRATNVARFPFPARGGEIPTDLLRMMLCFDLTTSTARRRFCTDASRERLRSSSSSPLTRVDHIVTRDLVVRPKRRHAFSSPTIPRPVSRPLR